MPNSEPIVRQEQLHGLPQFCVNLAEALNRLVPDEARRQAVAQTSFSGECVLCGLSVSGVELIAVGAGEAEATNAKIARLRQGYCGRSGCDSRYYRLTFQPHPAVDWNQAFTQSRTVAEEQHDQAQAEAAEARALERARRWKLAGRIAVGLGVLCVLYIVRQWYTGGTIPILRQPERFTTDPASLQQRPPE